MLRKKINEPGVVQSETKSESAVHCIPKMANRKPECASDRKTDGTSEATGSQTIDRAPERQILEKAKAKSNYAKPWVGVSISDLRRSDTAADTSDLPRNLNDGDEPRTT